MLNKEFPNLVKGVDMTIKVSKNTTSEIAKLSKNTPVKMTKEDALSQIKKAENLVKVSRPKSSYHGYTQASGFMPLWLISLLGSTLSLTFLLASLITNDYSTIAISSILGLSSISYAVGIPFTETRQIEFFNKKSRFRKMLCLMFLNKKIKKSVTEALETIQKNEQMQKIHQVLISKVVNELESSGALGVVNDFNDPENDRFVDINMKSGDFEYLSRKEIEKKMGLEPDPLVEYQKSVLEVVSNDKILADKDFKELFA